MIRRIKEYIPKMKANRMLGLLKDQLGGEDVFQYLEETYKPYEPTEPKPKSAGKKVANEWGL